MNMRRTGKIASLCFAVLVVMGAVGQGCGAKQEGSSAAAGGTAGTSGATLAGGAGRGGNAGLGGQAGFGGESGGAAGGVAADASTVDGSMGNDECRQASECPRPPCPFPGCQTMCALGDDGWHHCLAVVFPVSVMCTGEPTYCCTSADCNSSPQGRCVPYTYQYCGGPPPPPGNQCIYDECDGDEDCRAKPNGFCATSFPHRCIYGPCATNAGCTRGAGGTCVMRRLDPSCASEVVYCRYASDSCRTNDDCKADAGPYGQVCSPNPDLQGARCIDRGPPPP
jgi:hypothetical protein